MVRSKNMSLKVAAVAAISGSCDCDFGLHNVHSKTSDPNRPALLVDGLRLHMMVTPEVNLTRMCKHFMKDSPYAEHVANILKEPVLIDFLKEGYNYLNLVKIVQGLFELAYPKNGGEEADPKSRILRKFRTYFEKSEGDPAIQKIGDALREINVLPLSEKKEIKSFLEAVLRAKVKSEAHVQLLCKILLNKELFAFLKNSDWSVPIASLLRIYDKYLCKLKHILAEFKTPSENGQKRGFFKMCTTLFNDGKFQEDVSRILAFVLDLAPFVLSHLEEYVPKDIDMKGLLHLWNRWVVEDDGLKLTRAAFQHMLKLCPFVFDIFRTYRGVKAKHAQLGFSQFTVIDLMGLGMKNLWFSEEMLPQLEWMKEMNKEVTEHFALFGEDMKDMFSKFNFDFSAHFAEAFGILIKKGMLSNFLKTILKDKGRQEFAKKMLKAWKMPVGIVDLLKHEKLQKGLTDLNIQKDKIRGMYLVYCVNRLGLEACEKDTLLMSSKFQECIDLIRQVSEIVVDVREPVVNTMLGIDNCQHSSFISEDVIFKCYDNRINFQKLWVRVFRDQAYLEDMTSKKNQSMINKMSNKISSWWNSKSRKSKPADFKAHLWTQIQSGEALPSLRKFFERYVQTLLKVVEEILSPKLRKYLVSGELFKMLWSSESSRWDKFKSVKQTVSLVCGLPFKKAFNVRLFPSQLAVAKSWVKLVRKDPEERKEFLVEKARLTIELKKESKGKQQDVMKRFLEQTDFAASICDLTQIRGQMQTIRLCEKHREALAELKTSPWFETRFVVYKRYSLNPKNLVRLSTEDKKSPQECVADLDSHYTNAGKSSAYEKNWGKKLEAIRKNLLLALHATRYRLSEKHYWFQYESEALTKDNLWKLNNKRLDQLSKKFELLKDMLKDELLKTTTECKDLFATYKEYEREFTFLKSDLSAAFWWNFKNMKNKLEDEFYYDVGSNIEETEQLMKDTKKNHFPTKKNHFAFSLTAKQELVIAKMWQGIVKKRVIEAFGEYWGKDCQSWNNVSYELFKAEFWEPMKRSRDTITNTM